MNTTAGTEQSDTPNADQPEAGQDGADLEGLTYGEALEELEDLLDELEGADVDVDLLAARVARGVQLVRFCKARLEVVTADVDDVVAELISVEAGGESEAEDP
ncbi:MAG: exodeoxyribonuclease VII small subunit [Actinomycetota bacterium]